MGYTMYTLMKDKSHIQKQNSPLSHNFSTESVLLKQQLTALRQDLHETRLQMRENQVKSQNMSSHAKGVDGQEWLLNYLQSAFPDDSFKDCSKEKMSGDILMEPCQSAWAEMLIESKKYKSVVSGSEVQKFYRDMERTGKPLGLFISLTSSISRIKRFEIRRGKNGSIMLFIPNAQSCDNGIVLGVLALQHIYQFDQKTKTQVNNLECLRDNITEYLASIEQYAEDDKKSTFDMDQKLKSIGALTMELRADLVQKKTRTIALSEKFRTSVLHNV